jgi:hypothetical protein
MKLYKMSWDAIQERIFLESQLERRLQFFLFFFIAVVVISLIIPPKEIAMIFLVLTVILSWLLTVSLWFLANRVNAADKALPTQSAGPRFMEKGIRFFLAKVLPVTASFILTSFLIVGISGVADSLLPYKHKVEQAIESGEKKIDRVYSEREDGSHFESVDSLIEKNKTVSQKGKEVTFDNSPAQTINKDVIGDQSAQQSTGIVKPAPKKVSVMLAVDASHKAPKQDEDATRNNVPSSPSGNQGVTSAYKPDPHFAPIDKIIEKGQNEAKQTAKNKTPITRVDTIKKKVTPDPNFQNIEKVIKK